MFVFSFVKEKFAIYFVGFFLCSICRVSAEYLPSNCQRPIIYILV